MKMKFLRLKFMFGEPGISQEIAYLRNSKLLPR